MLRYLVIFLLALLGPGNDAAAFWGSSAENHASGLNVAEGFDVNTITSITGTVTTLPARVGGQEPAVLTLTTAQGAVMAILGPWWYWEEHAIPLAVGQEVTITGSRAQGQDGSTYVFVQQLGNSSTGASVSLRSASGIPNWSRNAADRPGGMRTQHNRPMSGPGNRSSGMHGGRR